MPYYSKLNKLALQRLLEPKQYSITSSMSRRGNRWDNACSESLFGSLKVERLHGQRFVTRRHARNETIAWLLWYNKSRVHSTLAYVSPMQIEQTWLVAQARQFMISVMGYAIQGQGQLHSKLGNFTQRFRA
jgi:transposase InsO family protein